MFIPQFVHEEGDNVYKTRFIDSILLNNVFKWLEQCGFDSCDLPQTVLLNRLRAIRSWIVHQEYKGQRAFWVGPVKPLWSYEYGFLYILIPHI